MGGLELTPNMEKLLRMAVKELSATIIIISDSNSEFISHILKVKELDHLVDRVFTNPASWSDDGLLTIKPYHHQETCKLSTKNLCKHSIMEEYIKNCGKTFSFICYVGDGKNDFCPMWKLAENDLACIREGYSLQKYIPQMEKDGRTIR